MRAQHQILGNLRENKEDWYYLCNDAEQLLFKVKEQCKDERAIKTLERMIIELNSIRMEQYNALNEYVLVEDSNKDIIKSIIKAIEDNYVKEEKEYYKKYGMDESKAHPPYWTIEPNGENGIIVDIPWGDWKHDHGYCSSLVERTANELGYDCVEDESEVYEEDGSDTYSAKHYFYFDINLNESTEDTVEYSATIYQIKDIANCNYAFRDYDEAKDKINMDDYDAVASIVLPKKGSTSELLEQIFMLGNTNKDAFNVLGKFRSISVSDIIELDNEVYYVDSFGFKKIK